MYMQELKLMASAFKSVTFPSHIPKDSTASM